VRAAAALLAALALAAVPQAAGDSISGTVRANPFQLSLTVAPSTTHVGAFLTAAVTATNLADTPVPAMLTLELPLGLAAASVAASLVVPAHGSATASFAVCAQSPGTYVVAAHGETATDRADSVAVLVTVAPGDGPCINHPPVCATVAVRPSTLWPPNHKLVPVALGAATDPDGDSLTSAIDAVTQDEPVNTTGDGDASPDAVRNLLDPSSVILRAERSGLADGRVYRVAYTVTDGRGGSCSGIARVAVPVSRQSFALESPFVYDSFGA